MNVTDFHWEIQSSNKVKENITVAPMGKKLWF